MHTLLQPDEDNIRRQILLTHPELNLPFDFQLDYVDLTHLAQDFNRHPYAAYVEPYLMKHINELVQTRCFDEQGGPIGCKHIHLAINVTGFTPFMVANARMRLEPGYFQAAGIGSITLIDNNPRPFSTPGHAYAGALPALRAMTSSRWTDTEGSHLGEMAVVDTIKRLLDTIDDQQRQLALKDNEIVAMRQVIYKGR